MKKFCTKCGKSFDAVGREVICPSCKQAAEEESKRAAVLRAKRASWSGESVPVRISGRASTVIREYGASNSLPFAQALDDILKGCFKGIGAKWEDIVPYKSHRRDKHATESKPQDKAQDAQEVTKAAGKPQDTTQEVKTVKQAAKTASKASASKASASSSKASK